jgi:16S rRNA U1498 N3-methylase RsmE
MDRQNQSLNSSLLPHRTKVHIVKVYRIDQVTGIQVLKGTGALVYLEVSKSVNIRITVQDQHLTNSL